MKWLENLKNRNSFFYIVINMIERYNAHEVGATGASLAYFFILSIFPFLIFLNALIATIDFTPEKMPPSFYELIPKEIIRIIQGYLRYIETNSTVELFSFGIVATIFSASKGISGMLKALEKSYNNVGRKPGFFKFMQGIIGTAIFGLAILVCFISISIGNEFWVFLSRFFVIPDMILISWDYIKWFIIFFTLFLGLGFVHLTIPDKKIDFKKIVPGTLFSIVSWISISYFFTFYITHFSSYTEIYGSLGSIIVLLLWLYLTGVIIVMGGELNQILLDMQKKE